MLCGDQIKEQEMGGPCGTYGGDEKHIQEHVKEGDNLGDLGVDEKIILK
jgi:hypothetical protein